MENKEIRKLNLAILIKECKTAAALGEKCNVSEVYLRQVINGVKDKNGRERGLGNTVARKLEIGCGKPTGWMDILHAAEGGELVYVKGPLRAQLLKVSENVPDELIEKAIRDIVETAKLLDAVKRDKPE